MIESNTISTLYEDNYTKIQLLRHPDFREQVVAKSYKPTSNAPTAKKALLNEYEVSRDLALPGVRKTLRLEQLEGRQALLLEYVEGIPLAQYLQDNEMSLKEVLQIACSIIEIIGRLHQKQVIHKDVSPYNILINQLTGAVTLIDFSISAKINLAASGFYNPKQIEGTLPYLAPEQTGRMNRPISSKCDFYAFGCVLYEMLCGRPPFQSEEPMKMLHYHIARLPTPPHQIEPGVPEMVSRVVLKLLQKNAEDRYQSADGVWHDLNQCLSIYSKGSTIPEFELGSEDHPTSFTIPDKLYGRDKEKNILLDSIQRVTKGNPELVLVSGYSGIGKSALIQELYKPISEQAGYFLKGKFNEYETNVPFQALLQAFRDFAKSIITQEDETIQYWRKLILDAVGGNGRLLIDSIPEFEIILGEQSPLPDLPPTEAQSRFRITIQNFVRTISRPNHPLVIFLDDLQWADAASLNMMRLLLSMEGNSCFLIIGAYRDNEVNEIHPFRATINQLKGKGIQLTSIRLLPLNRQETGQLLEDTLKFNDREKIDRFSELVIQKTNGNPFFIREFLKVIHEKGLIYYQPKAYQWEWDQNEIRKLGVTDNLGELLAQKITSLPEETRRLLSLAACLGGNFQMGELVRIAGSRAFQVLEKLEPAIKDSLLIPGSYYYRVQELGVGHLNLGEGGFFRFPHDQVREAFYSLIPKAERPAIHMKIARTLLEQALPKHFEEQLFNIATHFKLGGAELHEPEERLQVSELFGKAGVKAADGGAYRPALDYFKAAIALLPENAWEKHYQLTHHLHESATEAAYSTTRFEEMENYAQMVFERSLSMEDKTKTYNVLIAKKNGDSEFHDALELIIDALKELNFKIKRNPSVPGLASIFFTVLIKLNRRSIEQLEQLPKMTDARVLSIMNLLYSAFPMAYQLGRPTFMVATICKAILLSLRYGIAPQTPMAFTLFGNIIAIGLGHFKRGVAYGGFSLRQEAKNPDRRWFPFLAAGYYTVLHHFSYPAREAVKAFQFAYQSGLETGNVYNTSTSIHSALSHGFWLGYNLHDLKPEFDKAYLEIKEFNVMTWVHWSALYVQAIYNLTEGEHPHLIDGAYFNEMESQGFFEETGEQTARFSYLFMKFYLLTLFGFEQEAEQVAEGAYSLRSSVPGNFPYVIFIAYYGVFSARRALHSSNKAEKRKWLKKAKRFKKTYRLYTRLAPMNFENKLYLIQASIAEAKGKKGMAALLYARSVDLAKKQQLLPEEALAAELTGRFHLTQHNSVTGAFFIVHAYHTWLAWGATKKAEQLQQTFPEILRVELEKKNSLDKASSTSSLKNSLEQLDLETLVKAGASISGEIILEKLVIRLLDLTMENAGAQRGFLLLKRQRELLVCGGRDLVSNEEYSVTQPAFGSQLMPEAVLQYVNRTEKNLILEDAPNNPTFSQDPYISRWAPKSILCSPINYQGKLLGILYLENNLTRKAFTEDRLEFLNVLSGQMAVSLNNALLYEDLEQKVRDRTQEIEKERKKSEQLLLNILPKATAEELKVKGRTKARKYENVTILFTDFVGFTKLAELLSPEELVEELDAMFSAFDQLMSKYQLEKIKTIGDSYMCAGGVPEADPSSVFKVVEAAKDMLEFMKKQQQKNRQTNKPEFHIRIGIHTGTVVAGVVGFKKFAFDIWGDDVNLAARMESSGLPDHINVSESTYALIKDRIPCTHRGKIKAKNKGEVDMYLVNATND